MPNRFQIKRTTTTGLLPNVSNSSNTSYIAAGELAINLTDRKLLSSNGSATFEVGANLASIVVGTAFTQTSGNANFDSGVLFVDGTNNRVGIGTTSPVTSLEVKGTGFVASSISGDSTSETQLRFFTNTGARVSQQANQALIFDTNATERMRITSAGNLGVGTISPSYRLVAADSSTDGGWLYSTGVVSILGLGGYSGASDGAFSLRYDRSTGNITFNGGSRDTPTERMRIDGSGNVGIGTGSTTSARLVVVSPANSPSLMLTDNTQSTLTVKHETGNLLTYEVTGTATQRWVGNSLERMRLDASGNLGIGNASPAHTLSVTGTTNLGGAVTGITTLAAGNTSITGFITATGDITAFFSDDRLKDRYSNIPNAVEKVKSLNGFYYEPNITAQDLGYQKEMHVGVSAQEVNAIMPEIVVPAPIDNKYMTVKYDRLIPLLIEAIKEQQIQIDELKAQLKKD